MKLNSARFAGFVEAVGSAFEVVNFAVVVELLVVGGFGFVIAIG